jgi:hypothetical protein
MRVNNVFIVGAKCNNNNNNKKHCFLNIYRFHSLQEVLNIIGNLYDNLWLTSLTMISYQTRRINWSKLIFYFTRHQAFICQEFFNNYFSLVFFTIIRDKG